MNAIVNYRALCLKDLKDICRRDPAKYRGFSQLKKNDLVNFMYRKDTVCVSSSQDTPHTPIIPDLSQMFETDEEKDERITSYTLERPDQEIIDAMIQGLKNDFGGPNISYKEHVDETNDIIYKATKKKYVSLHGSLGEHGEMLLFHGTDHKNVQKILSDDFNLTNRPVHGSLYGRGIYFTNDIKKAASYSEKNKKTKYILICNVHVGDICRGSPTMDVHPRMAGRHDGVRWRKTYDTSVDNIDYPKQFVKKKNGTYNILGIITIKNYELDKFSGSFTIENFRTESLTLYWVPPNLVSTIQSCSIFNISNVDKFKKLSTIEGAGIWRMGRLLPTVSKQRCQIGHMFVVVAHFPNDWDPLSRDAIVRIITSKGKNETITID